MNKVMVRLLVFILLTVLAVGGVSIWWENSASPVNPKDTTVKTFTVQKAENIRSVSTRLKSEGLIKDQISFFLRIKLMGFDNKIQAGNFLLSRSMNAGTIITQLTHGKLDLKITTLEGWRDEEIAAKLTETLEIPQSDFLKIAKEGYMFPDTYLVPQDASIGAIVKMFEDNFDKRVTPDLRLAIKQQGLTFDQGIILASLVEREGVSDADRPVIAGILLKRLQKNWPLQVDATIQYALGFVPLEKSWWKKELNEEDKKIDSQYNTYQNVGLPRTPICNPGLSSIQAVANPKESDYFYYLHDAKGEAHYAQTLDEHNANIEKYLR